MFHIIREGEAIKNGFTFKMVSDGGYSFILRANSVCFYLRVRGKANTAKPRILYGKRKIGD